MTRPSTLKQIRRPRQRNRASLNN